MDTITAAQELRSLLIAHDKAQREIQSLDCQLHRMTGRVTAQAAGGHVVGGMKMLQRTCILQAVREMFVAYRTRKWMQVQTHVRVIMHNLGQPGDDLQDDDPDHSNHEVIVIANAMSLDFCQLNRFG